MTSFGKAEMDGAGVSGLDVSFGNRVIFRNFSISFAPGTVTGLSAPSGSGKTTLLNHIAAACSSVSYSFQEPRLISRATVLENVMIPLVNVMDRRSAMRRAERYASLMGLEKVGSRRPDSLSGGERQRVSLARAFAFPSRILLLDEPFQSQDADTRNVLIRSIRALLAEDRRTVVLVSHSLEELRCLCTRIVTLGGSPLSVIGDSLRLEEVNSGTCPCGGSVHCK